MNHGNRHLVYTRFQLCFLMLLFCSCSNYGYAEPVSSKAQDLYVADFEIDSVFRCSIASGDNGTLNSCKALSGSFGAVTVGLTCATAWNDSTYAYVLDNGGQLFQCLLTAEGLEQCHVTPPPNGGWSPIGIALGPRNAGGVQTQFAYVADNSSNNIYRCLVNRIGALSGCRATPSTTPGWFPSGIVLASVNHTLYAYIASNPSPNSAIYRCLINPDGTLGAFNTCLNPTPKNIDASVWGPQGIAFATVSNNGAATQYAYVADSDGGHVYQCTLDITGKPTNGTLTSCTATPSAGAPSWNPTGITFVTSAGQQYAYVADGRGSGLLYRCMLSNDGALSDCRTTPNDAPWTGVFSSATMTGIT